MISSSASATLSENNSQAFYTIDVNDPDSSDRPSVTLASTGDGAFFDLDQQTLSLSAKGRLDFERPVDENNDNIYDVTVTATDSDNANTSLTIAVTITDLVDDVSFNLNPSLPPSDNFDLTTWKLQLPINDAGGLSGQDSAEVSETELNDGYESEYYFTGPDGAMVFRAPDEGATTSANTRYTRVELREMLRAGDRTISTSGLNGNNWVLSSAPQDNQDAAGGVDGNLKVSMAVNRVIEGGETFQKGRVIIGQIHAGTDEPIRLYYRKLPGNTHGSIYAIHELVGGEDILHEIIGSADSDAANPANGILLDEIFNFEIDAVGGQIDVTLSRDDGTIITTYQIDISESGYEDHWMYFKTGAYQVASHGDNTLDIDEFTQVSIYSMSSSHD